MNATEYAKHVGVTERTVRRRIRQGLIRAELVDGPYGPEYQILEGVSDSLLDDPTPSRTIDQDPCRTRPTPSPAPPDVTPDIVSDLLDRLDRSHRENMELSGRLGYFQRRIHELEETVKALQAPENVPTVEPATAPDSSDQASMRRPWWQFWRLL